MKILVIGSGGREHALAWKLAGEGHTVFGAPGNPGIARIGACLDTTEFLSAARGCGAELTVVGPEVPLAAGVVDQFRAQGLKIVGPTQAMAQLEASKIYSKDFMHRMGIPTARFVRTSTEQEGLDALAAFSLPVVIKADGLAAGKGVVIAHTPEEARAAVQQLGPLLVIEEFLTGEEVSFIALCDGKNILPLEASQDHKTVGDGDTGPNTGGMGAYVDGRILSPGETQSVLDLVMEPAVRKTNFTGFLYAGLMMTAEGPKVLEFNARLGDPETQPLMHRMGDGWAETLMASATGELAGVKLQWKLEPSVCVVAAAHGYPGTVRSGDRITGIEKAEMGPGRPVVFQAGTKEDASGLVTSGGRVLGVTASGSDLTQAIANCYQAVSAIQFAGMHYRRDIGSKGLKRWV